MKTNISNFLNWTKKALALSLFLFSFSVSADLKAELFDTFKIGNLKHLKKKIRQIEKQVGRKALPQFLFNQEGRSLLELAAEEGRTPTVRYLYEERGRFGFSVYQVIRALGATEYETTFKVLKKLFVEELSIYLKRGDFNYILNVSSAIRDKLSPEKIAKIEKALRRKHWRGKAGRNILIIAGLIGTASAAAQCATSFLPLVL